MSARFFAKSALASFVLALIAVAGIAGSSPAEARVFVGFGFAPFGWGAPYPYYPYPYYAPPVVYAPPAYDPGPVYQADPAAAPATWYYCNNPRGYYPYVQQCSQPWRPVAAQPQQ